MRARNEDPAASFPLRILTHNIRYETRNPSNGELPWDDRAEPICWQLLYHSRHCFETIICLQEVLYDQLVDLWIGLVLCGSGSPGGNEDITWQCVGVGRDDGKKRGEFSPIFYHTMVWKEERSFTMWLSPTPWVAGSKGWDAASVRIMTVVILRHRGTGRRVLAANTHLDDQGSVSRREGAKLIVKTLREVAQEEAVDGYFLAGDLNSETDGEAYLVLNEENSGLQDLKRQVMSKREGRICYGNENTFTGFNEDEKAKVIDFIHLGTKSHTAAGSQDGAASVNKPDQESPWQAVEYAVLSNRFDDGVYLSDHRAVVGDVILQ